MATTWTKITAKKLHKYNKQSNDDIVHPQWDLMHNLFCSPKDPPTTMTIKGLLWRENVLVFFHFWSIYGSECVTWKCQHIKTKYQLEVFSFCFFTSHQTYFRFMITILSKQTRYNHQHWRNDKCERGIFQRKLLTEKINKSLAYLHVADTLNGEKDSNYPSLRVKLEK